MKIDEETQMLKFDKGQTSGNILFKAKKGRMKSDKRFPFSGLHFNDSVSNQKIHTQHIHPRTHNV